MTEERLCHHQDAHTSLMLERDRDGRCAECGIQTHAFPDGGSLTRTKRPLTIQGEVLRGRCLLCMPINGRSNRCVLSSTTTQVGSSGYNREAWFCYYMFALLVVFGAISWQIFIVSLNVSNVLSMMESRGLLEVSTESPKTSEAAGTESVEATKNDRPSSNSNDEEEEVCVCPRISPDFITTESGLKYRVIQEGTGKPPHRHNPIQVHYTGWLDDFNGNKKLDSSRDRDRPLVVRIGAGKVVKGLEETYGTMCKGERRLVIVPPKLGYGDRVSSLLPRDATLYYDVEIVDIM